VQLIPAPLVTYANFTDLKNIEEENLTRISNKVHTVVKQNLLRDISKIEKMTSSC